MGNSQDILLAVFVQLPFFCYRGNILEKEHQDDIAKYTYCKDTGTSAYNGTYGETPNIWLRKYYAIKSALYVREKYLTEKMKAENGNK